MTSKNNITFQTFDYALIVIALFMLITTWCYVVISYAYLPETIAVHFDGSGQPDGYNSKSSIWIAPILFSALTIGLVFGAKNPENVNIPYRKMTLAQKKASSKVLLFSSGLLSIVVFLISLSMIETSMQRNFPTKWIIPTMGVLVVFYLVCVFYYQFKLKK